MIRALRIHQWSKNLLLALPILCAHQLSDPQRVLQLALAFVCFCLGASGQYLLNDTLDAEADRVHPTKRFRPVASGQVSVASARLLAAILIPASLAGGWFISRDFFLLSIVYHVLTVAYSYWLKHQAIVDVLLLACLYVLRVFAGGAATGIQVSQWLLTFSLFFFLTLAVLKRFAEMRSRTDNSAVRDYFPGDEYLLAAMGVSAGYLSVLVLAFYIQQPITTGLYRQPGWLWLLCPLLLHWISRLWLIAFRRAMPGDPLDFSLTDAASYLTVVLASLLVYTAI